MRHFLTISSETNEQWRWFECEDFSLCVPTFRVRRRPKHVAELSFSSSSSFQ